MARANEPLLSVPYRVDYNGWFTIKVQVNGHGPYDFVIDTGATQSLIFQNLADIRNFPPTGGPGQTVLGLTAQGAFPTYTVAELRMGSLSLQNLTTVILPDWSVDRKPSGVIGLDFLSRYICVFDAPNGLLHFYAPDNGPTTLNKWRSTGLKPNDFGLPADPVYVIEARIDARRVRFMLDLGASGTVINKSAAGKISNRGVSVSIRPSGGDARARITDSLEKSVEARTIKTRRIRVGKTYWYNRALEIHNATIFDELGVQKKPFGLFGADLLRNMSFALDFPGERLHIGPRGPIPRGPIPHETELHETVPGETRPGAEP